MVESVAYILLIGSLFSFLFKKMHLPKLLGMIFAGILIGPYFLNILDTNMLAISSDLRQMALIIILTRAGLSLDLSDLKKVGRPAILMCFLPACFEMMATIFIAPLLFDISYLDAAILASVIAAVSPAVVVPKMIELMDKKLGTRQAIPQLILAGASVDDVFLIVMFSCFTSLASGNGFSFTSLLQVPFSILNGILIGYLLGYIISLFFNKVKMDSISSFIFVLSFSFLLMKLEAIIKPFIPFSGYLSIMALGLAIHRNCKEESQSLNSIYSKCWMIAQIFLFVLVGASVNIKVAFHAGINSILLILFVLLIRIIGVFCCLIKTSLNRKERFFIAISYIPKATVQAAMGGIPLAMGFSCGELILAISVISILISAPVGAILMDVFDKICLIQENV